MQCGALHITYGHAYPPVPHPSRITTPIQHTHTRLPHTHTHITMIITTTIHIPHTLTFHGYARARTHVVSR